MTSSADLFPPRRPIFFPVVIATVFLTIIGMTGGFMLGERHRRLAGAANPPQRTTPTATTAQHGVPVPSAAAPSFTRGSGVLCPEATRQTAAKLGFSPTLRQVMKVETEDGTTVWICQDDTGGYFYQGKTGGPDAVLQEGKNGLFLSNVKHSEDREEYVAIADNGNHIVVNRRQVEIDFADRKRATQISPVVPSK